MVTTRDIAKAAGVSHPTVSSVLNDRWRERRICVATRDRILATARELDYRPNRLARGLRSRKTNTVGLVIRTFSHPTQAELNERLVGRISSHRFESLVTVVPDLQDSRGIEDLYYSHFPEAIILGPIYNSFPDAFLNRLSKNGFPIVGFECDGDVPFDHVTQDRDATLSLAFDHLAQLGHQRIGYIQAFHDPAHERRVSRVAGARFAGSHAHWGTFENGFRFVTELDRSPGAATAYVFQDPCFATGFVRGAQERGIKIPEDVAFVVCGNCELARYLSISLTTVYADMDDLAEKVVTLMIQRIRGKAPLQRQRVIVPSRLVIGESSRK